VSTDHLIELAVTFGPIILAAVGTLLTAVFGVLAAIARWAWKAHQKRMLNMADAVQKLAKAIDQGLDGMVAEHTKIQQSVQGLRAELQMANRNTDTMKNGLLKVEGAMETQRKTIQDYVQATDRLSGKMEAIFRFIDAPQRATDSRG
jgi:hypothetical protein